MPDDILILGNTDVADSHQVRQAIHHFFQYINGPRIPIKSNAATGTYIKVAQPLHLIQVAKITAR